MESEILRITDKLPKYIEYEGCAYSLIIHKNDWDGNPNKSWIVMFAKENKKSISEVKFQIKVTGATLIEVLQNMENSYEDYKKENKGNPKITKM